LSVIPA